MRLTSLTIVLVTLRSNCLGNLLPATPTTYVDSTPVATVIHHEANYEVTPTPFVHHAQPYNPSPAPHHGPILKPHHGPVLTPHHGPRLAPHHGPSAAPHYGPTPAPH